MNFIHSVAENEMNVNPLIHIALCLAEVPEFS